MRVSAIVDLRIAVFRPLPGLRQANRLVIVGSTYLQEGFGGSSYPDYRDPCAGNSDGIFFLRKTSKWGEIQW
jgi:hypothetical protein